MQNTARGCKNTQLALRASSAHFQVAHQPRIEASVCGRRFAGTHPSRLCTSNTNTHPLAPEDLKEFVFAERISFARRAPQHYLPPKALCVPIFKEANGKTQAIHLAFCAVDSEPLRITQPLPFITQRAMTHGKKVTFQLFTARLIASPRARSHKSRSQNAAKRREPVCTHTPSNASFCKFYTMTHTY